MPQRECKQCPDPTMQGLHVLQHEVLESIARGMPLEETLDQLCRKAETLAPEVVCSVLSVDRTGRLRTVAAPSLPPHYSTAIDGLQMGPNAGSCGAAAYLGEPVEVTDIANDPRWADFKDLALPIGLRACWSSPIRASDGRVVGVFAFYYRTCRGASPLDETIVEACVHLCAIALEQEERKQSIHRLAYYDSVTGIPNRAGLELYGERAVAAAIETGRGVAVHCFDLDTLKEVNDTLGRHAGDLLLKTVAERVSATLGPDDFFARVGGDEFVVVQTGADSTRDIEAFAARLIAAMSAALELEDATATIGASIGVACAPDHGRDLPALMKNADLAMHEAKTSGRGRFRVFDTRIESQIASDRQTRRELRRAIAGNELDLYFQPIVGLRAGEISGFEALVRWRHPGDGIRLPSQFLPVAEKAGMMDEIGDWALRRACASAASFPGSTRLCVNLSPSQLERPDFAFQVAKAIAASGLSPKQLELEITESTLLIENAATLTCLNDIRALGVSIALDDFGTGCSALSHLRVFPVDRVKIDRSFVQEAVVRPETASIVRTIIALARNLGLKTTGEGVETDAQLRMLRDFGCDEIQGFLVSPPRPIEAFVPNPFAIGGEGSASPLAGFAEAFQSWLRPLAETAVGGERAARGL